MCIKGREIVKSVAAAAMMLFQNGLVKKSTIAVIAACLLVVPPLANAAPVLPKFSIDPASPSIDGNITPDDVLVPGPGIFRQGSDLGLKDSFFTGEYDNLDALSFGKDPIIRPVFFSVDRVAVGLQGSAVYGQAQPGIESAAGDVYMALPPFGSNSLHINETALGLKPGFLGDDLDALELDTLDTSFLYFSIDFLSYSNAAGTLANDIFLNVFGNIYASGEVHIGLDPYDDLDALVLWDVYNPGMLDPGIDKALFSLSTFSPNTFTSGLGAYSPADILFTDFTGTFTLWASATEIGLRPDDELDALDTVIPEPGTFVLVAGGGLVLLAWARKKNSRGKLR